MGNAGSPPGRTGRRMGQVQAAGAGGMGLGLLAALALVKAGVRIRPLYVVAGAAALLAAAACLGIPRRLKTPGPRFVLRRRYGLFYALSFLEGWRKQIFIAFAGFLLVKRYQTPLQTMLLLWVATQCIAWAVSPLVGRLIDRLGERKVLMLYFSCLTAFLSAMPWSIACRSYTGCSSSITPSSSSPWPWRHTWGASPRPVSAPPH